MNNQQRCGDDCHGECSGEVDGIPHCPRTQQQEKPAPGAPPEREPAYLISGNQIAALRNDIDFLKSFGALSRAEIETFDDLEIRLCEIELNEADQK